MNTLQIIKSQIEKAARLHDAQIAHTSYRGVKTNRAVLKPSETHGTYCYRGHAYTKLSLTYKLNTDTMGG